jgi:hypothetical protein
MVIIIFGPPNLAACLRLAPVPITPPKAARKVVSGFSPQDHEKQDARFESARLCGLKPRNYFPARAFGPALRFGLP